MRSYYGIWTWATARRRFGRLAATALGIAVAVALIATLAGFFAATDASMTGDAIGSVPIDWQVQLAPGSDLQTASDELARSPGVTKLVQVGYFDTPGFQAKTGDTVQTTGPGKVLGLGDGYREAFPSEVRDLIGQGSVLLAQQTAANLHAAPGTTVSIMRPGLPPAEVTIDGVVELPYADALFQVVGAPSGSTPQAPPDNVLLLPLYRWHDLFDPVAADAPTMTAIQLHAAIPHNLPSSPTAAYTRVTGMERNFEQRMAGTALVADNLAARLDVARSDALYARVLFLFLGLPGIILAAVLTTVLVAAGAGLRRREQALLRLRGASAGGVFRLAGIEGALAGVAGSAIGLAIAVVAVRATFGRWTLGNGTSSTLLWGSAAAAIGLGLALLAVLIPAWRDTKQLTVAGARITVGRRTHRWWERIGLDSASLALSGVFYWRAARSGYQLVLAPEGVAAVSVSYTSFFAPLLLWIGVALLAVRLSGWLLSRNGRYVAPALRPISGRLAPLIGASMSRQHGRIAVGIVIVLLAVGFAWSTAIFNATYEAQALVDAELSNGADVTVTGGGGRDLAGYASAIAALPGVRAVEPMQHRFAYVGSDLQDLYGIDTASLTNAARLSDAYFVGGTADEVMARLAKTPDGVLVSPETVFDYQLQPGDTIRLRLQDSADQQYHTIAFRYVGIAREFPTAPSDSFLVANADYIATQTGSSAAETLLIKVNAEPKRVADQVRAALGPTSGASVRDIEEQRALINSSLTSVSLHGLTRIELAFAIGLVLAGAGLVLALGMEERRRALAIATALGATRRQVGAFVWCEAGVILVAGLVGGGLLGWGVAHMLIKLLTHVFDPPPQGAVIPFPYLNLVTLAVIASIALAAYSVVQRSRRNVLATIRKL